MPRHTFVQFALVALVCLARTVGGQESAGSNPVFHQPAPGPPVHVAGIHDPKDAVRLAGTNIVVPPGKVLIITALGSIQGGPVSLQISNFWPNGASEDISINTLPSAPIVAIPSPGVVVPTGAVLNGGAVFGYFVDVLGGSNKARRTVRPDNVVHVVGLPGDPREFVYIRSNPANPNDSYTVPPGKRLIVTGVGGSHQCTWASVRDYRATMLYVELAAGALFYDVPAPGIPFDSGRIVNPVAESTATPFPGRVIGYLIDV